MQLKKLQQRKLLFFFAGLDPSQEGEGLDRVNGSIELPGKQKDLINQLAMVNPNIVVVIVSGGICGVNPFINNIKGLIQAFYPGQEGGNAIAQVLFGDYNPSGKLPVTIPQSDVQLGSEITDFDFTNDYGCGYRWFDEKKYMPEFAFGFGLSYTTFLYSDMQVSPSSASAGTKITVSFNVKNTGTRSGEEVAQCYITKGQSIIQRPLKELKAFKKFNLLPGESKQIVMELSPNELYYYDEAGACYKVESGKYSVMVGGSSDSLPLRGNFSLTSGDEKSDLQIGNVYCIPRYPIAGEKVQFAATIINRGAAASPEGIKHQVNFYVNGTLISLSTELTTAIPAGGMALVNGSAAVNGTYFWNATQTGEYTIEAAVNADKLIPEHYYDNNTKQLSFTVYPPPPVNLALNKTVYASSIEAAGLEGSNVVDGNYSSRWASQFSDPQYLIIDLGKKSCV